MDLQGENPKNTFLLFSEVSCLIACKLFQKSAKPLCFFKGLI